MYIRRKVFSVAVDEYGEERLFSTTEIMSEEDYSEHLFSLISKDKKKEFKHESGDKVDRLGDKLDQKINRYLKTKKDLEAEIEAYDENGPRNSHKLGKQMAKKAAIAGALISGGLALKNGNGLGRSAIGAGVGAGLGALGAYGGARVGHLINKGVNHLSTNSAKTAQLVADRAKRSLGRMSDEEYLEKYGRKKS